MPKQDLPFHLYLHHRWFYYACVPILRDHSINSHLCSAWNEITAGNSTFMDYPIIWQNTRLSQARADCLCPTQRLRSLYSTSCHATYLNHPTTQVLFPPFPRTFSHYYPFLFILEWNMANGCFALTLEIWAYIFPPFQSSCNCRLFCILSSTVAGMCNGAISESMFAGGDY